MNENTHRKWSIRIQALTTICVVGGGLIGLLRYFDTTSKQFQQPLWNRQIMLYFEVSEIASTLASTNNRDEWMSARVKFLKLINGPMCIVQDNNVQENISIFANKLLKINWKDIEDSYKNRKNRPPLERESIMLSYALRDSIATAMNLMLPSVRNDWREWNKRQNHSGR